jgi:hypothetical protein
MIQELLDVLDETIQDLDEGGFGDEAEQLYEVAYDTEWASEQEMVEEIGRGIMRIQARRDGEIPQPILTRMVRCLEIVRRMRPDMSME